MNVGTFLSVVLVVEVLAIGVVAYLSFSGFFAGMRFLARVGIWVMTLGLMVQIMRTLHYFEFGAYPVDRFIPWWAAKDLGASLVVCDLFLLSLGIGGIKLKDYFKWT